MAKILDLSGTAPEDGQTLGYDAATLKWRPVDPPDSGTSGVLTVVSGSVALDNSVAAGTLVGYRATASTTFTGQGGSVTLAAGAYVFERVSGGWEYRTLVEGTGLTPLAPDTTNPAAGSLAVTGVTHNAATLTVTGASDNQALHATPYAFSTNNGSTWTGYQSSNVYAATGLTPSTSYTFRHRVRDASGNVSTGTAVTQSTAAAPVTPPAYTDAVQADNPVIYFPFTETAWPFADVEGAVTTVTQRTAAAPVVPAAQTIGNFPRSASFPGDVSGFGSGGVVIGRPAVLQGITAFTFEMLLRPAALPTGSDWMHLVSYGVSANPRVSFRVHTTGAINIQMFDEGVGFTTGAGAMTVGQDYHVAVTYDAAGVPRLYINGAQVGTAPAAPGFLIDGTAAEHNWHLGTSVPNSAGTAKSFNGNIAGLAFHGSALSAARILAHAQAAGLAA